MKNRNLFVVVKFSKLLVVFDIKFKIIVDALGPIDLEAELPLGIDFS